MNTNNNSQSNETLSTSYDSSALNTPPERNIMNMYTEDINQFNINNTNNNIPDFFYHNNNNNKQTNIKKTIKNQINDLRKNDKVNDDNNIEKEGQLIGNGQTENNSKINEIVQLFIETVNIEATLNCAEDNINKLEDKIFEMKKDFALLSGASIEAKLTEQEEKSSELLRDFQNFK